MKRSKEVVSYTMSRIRSKNTGIELALRKALTQKGLRYRLYSSKVFGHPDIVFNYEKVAIFCDSEFWHGFNFEENKTKIKSNTSYWIPKIERNIARDKEVNEVLKSQGFTVLRYWGEEIEDELPRVVDEIISTLNKRRAIQSKIDSIKEKTTLGYAEKDGSYLMLYRNKKKSDPNEGKWIGVGGHLEQNESPLKCMKREFKEETGLDIVKSKYLGIIYFLNDSYPPELMYLYKITDFNGEMTVCNEGELKFVPKDKILSLPLWEGDKAFLPLLDVDVPKPFKMELIYEGGTLKEINGPYFAKETKKKKRKPKNKLS